ncbi:MAG: Rpn family recombination-promoting nuclease/putative transposase [Leadbetterella sp.]|nr:Rpn family recombination-promoting nuclease/putative transposase [Leadbetterella sp.]
MPRNITNIHDKFIKQILSDKELAIDFLQQYLPESLVSSLDFDTLEQQDNSYITDQLKTSFSDLLWRVKMKDKENLQISLLLEHKSSADPKTAFQLLEYLALGYQKQLREKKKPELIVPILYYHGKKNWVFKPLEKYFTTYPDFLKKYIPVFSSEFINLAELSPEQIYALKNGLLGSAIMLQKYCFDPEELATHMDRIVENLNPYLDSNVTNSIFVYLITGIRLEKIYLADAVKKLPDEMSTKVMTIYDQLIQEGMEKTLQKTVLNAYDAGIDIATIRIITGEGEEKIKRILAQNNRI